jgi:hypothetical protein
MLRPPDHLNTTKHYRLYVKTRCLWSETHLITTQARGGPQRMKKWHQQQHFKNCRSCLQRGTNVASVEKEELQTWPTAEKSLAILKKFQKHRFCLKWVFAFHPMPQEVHLGWLPLVPQRNMCAVCVLLRARNFLHTRTSQMLPNERP